MTLTKWIVFFLLSLFVACAWAKPPKPPHHGMAPPPPPPPASPYGRIHLDMGRDMPKIDVDCGAQTSMRDCAEVAKSLIQQASDMGPAKPTPPKP